MKNAIQIDFSVKRDDSQQGHLPEERVAAPKAAGGERPCGLK
jgi:hypothetical protein